jgi:hypothetical protein
MRCRSADALSGSVRARDAPVNNDGEAAEHAFAADSLGSCRFCAADAYNGIPDLSVRSFQTPAERQSVMPIVECGVENDSDPKD